jgi:hypothetical protein
MAHDVFISHSAQNREVADAICAALEKAAIRCWVAPRDVRPGRPFPGEITRAIQQSKVMLLIFSSHSNNSEQVLREVQLATDSRLLIIRFRIEDVSMNDDLKYFLSSPHWLDALTPPLSNHIARLEIAIKELLGQSVEVTGKNVVGDPVQPEVSSAPPPAAPSAVAPTAPPPVPTPMPPPVPRESIARKEPELVASSPAKPERETIARKSSIPWILLAVAALVVFAGVVGVIFILLRQPKPSQRQTSTAPSHTTQTPKASPSPASPPARVAKVTKKPASEPARLPKTTPAGDTQDSDESEGDSAFERAGALKHPNESKKAPKSAFDRAGGNIDSDEPETEPSPEE